jgi:hypothetical protein
MPRVYLFRHGADSGRLRMSPRDLRATFAAAVVRGLTMTVWTEKVDIFGTIIKPVPVLVIDVQHDRLAAPTSLHLAPWTLTLIVPSKVEECPAENVGMLPPTVRPQHQYLLPGEAFPSLVLRPAVGPAAQEMAGVDPILPDAPRQMRMCPTRLGQPKFSHHPSDGDALSDGGFQKLLGVFYPHGALPGVAAVTPPRRMCGPILP